MYFVLQCLHWEQCGLVDVAVLVIHDGIAFGNALPTCAHNEQCPSTSKNKEHRVFMNSSLGGKVAESHVGLAV